MIHGSHWLKNWAHIPFLEARIQRINCVSFDPVGRARCPESLQTFAVLDTPVSHSNTRAHCDPSCANENPWENIDFFEKKICRVGSQKKVCLRLIGNQNFIRFRNQKKIIFCPKFFSVEKKFSIGEIFFIIFPQ